MSQQTPIFGLTRIASGAVADKRFVNSSGAQVAAAGGEVLGVSAYAAADKAPVNVNVLGTATVVSGAAVAVGDLVKSDASGKAIPQAGAGEIAGKALEAASGADQEIEILLIP